MFVRYLSQIGHCMELTSQEAKAFLVHLIECEMRTNTLHFCHDVHWGIDRYYCSRLCSALVFKSESGRPDFHLKCSRNNCLVVDLLRKYRRGFRLVDSIGGGALVNTPTMHDFKPQNLS